VIGVRGAFVAIGASEAGRGRCGTAAEVEVDADVEDAGGVGRKSSAGMVSKGRGKNRVMP
jgi:hypothetical protein